MAKLVAIKGTLGEHFKHRPPMGGLFPNEKQAQAWMKYYGRKGYESAVKVVLL